MNSKRTVLEFSDERRRDSLLRCSWNQITAGFKSKPEPKSTWYETATGDVTPWRLVVTPIRSAIISAIQSGDKQLTEQTIGGAIAFCRELEADFTSLLPSAGEEGIVTLALDETHMEGPANEVQAQLIANPCPTTAIRAVLPLERQYERLGALIRSCRGAARRAPAQASR